MRVGQKGLAAGRHPFHRALEFQRQIGGDHVLGIERHLAADQVFGDAEGDWILLADDGARDTVYGTVVHLGGDTIFGFETGKAGDVLAITGLAAKHGKLLDSVTVTDGVLSLSKVGGGTVVFADLDGTFVTDTMPGGDGAILVYVM